MTASDTATDPAQRGIFLVCRSQISPCDKTALFPTIPDTETVQRIGCKAPPRLVRQRADTPDESHMFSAQVRRGLNRAPRGDMGARPYTRPLPILSSTPQARRAGAYGPRALLSRGRRPRGNACVAGDSDRPQQIPQPCVSRADGS